MNFKELVKAIYGFFSKPQSAEPLGVYRILFGLLCLSNAVLLYPDLQVWFSESGALPPHVFKKLIGTDRLNLFLWFGSSPGVVSSIFWVNIGAALCMTLGVFTRLASLCLYVTLVSFHHRNIYVLHSGDTFLRIVSLFMIFTPSDEAYSLRRLYRVFAGKVDPIGHKDVFAPATRLIQFQVCLLYFATFYWKATGDHWMTGKAVYIVMQLGQFDRFPIPEIFKTVLFTKIATWSTLAIEAFAPFLLWFRDTRLWMIGVLVLLHLSLDYSLNIQLFQYVMISALVLFIRPEELQWVWRQIRMRISIPKRRIAVFFDGNCGFCKQIVNVLIALDIWHLINFHDARNPAHTNGYAGFSYERAETEILSCDPRGQWEGGFNTMRSIFIRTPLLAIPVLLVGWLPGVSRVGGCAYKWVARNRHRISALLPASATCQVKQRTI